MSNRYKKHGEINTRLYHIWAQMKSRCKSKRETYKNINVCDEWNDYIDFRNWANSNGYEDTLTIDRKDNSLGYSPENCRWVPRTVQNQNTRLLRSTNTIGYRGVYFDKRRNRYYARVYANNKYHHLGTSEDKHEMAELVNQFIISNNLHQPLNKIKEE